MSCGMVCLACNANACHTGLFASHATQLHAMQADFPHTQRNRMPCGQISLARNAIACHAGRFPSHATQLHAMQADSPRAQLCRLSCCNLALTATLLTKAYGLDAPSKCRHGCTGSEWRAACHMLKPARALEARVRITPHGAPLSRSMRLARAPDCKARQRPPLRRTAITCRIEPGCIQERMT